MSGPNGHQHQPTPLDMAFAKLGQGEVTIRLWDGEPAFRGKLVSMQGGVLVCVALDGRVKLIAPGAWRTIDESTVQLATAMPVPRSPLLAS